MDIDRQFHNSFGVATVEASHSFAVCEGRRNGWYVSSRTTFGTQTIIAESALAPADGGILMATYTHSQTDGSAPDVVASLHTLCFASDTKRFH
ncbi:MAG TPA: hypothetical protein VFL13_13065 [Candidatus Baltobacteraceae bacterium]|nr:hypothetical protein [Candidatus Baltobacteraceae bacterium]